MWGVPEIVLRIHEFTKNICFYLGLFRSQLSHWIIPLKTVFCMQTFLWFLKPWFHDPMLWTALFLSHQMALYNGNFSYLSYAPDGVCTVNAVSVLLHTTTYYVGIPERRPALATACRKDEPNTWIFKPFVV